jgi:UDP-glucose 4-epimerase
MRAVITGASGLIGRALVAELRRQGWQVDCLSRRPAGIREPGLAYHAADLNDPAALRAALHRIEGAATLFHLAALMPGHSPTPDDDALIRGNAVSTLHLFEAALETGIAHVVYASGASVIGTPSQLPITETHPLAPRSVYAISKLGGELFAEYLRRSRGLPATSLRITSPYGPGMQPSSVLPRFAAAAVRGERLTWFGSGARSQNFVHVRDVARAMVLASTRRAAGVYNIGGAEGISMKGLAELLVELTPGSGSTAGAAGILDPQEEERWEVSLRRAADDLAYVPSVRLRDGLREYLESL